MQRILEFDGFRGLLMIGVVLFHTIQAYSMWFGTEYFRPPDESFGVWGFFSRMVLFLPSTLLHAGVDCFFLMSSCLLTIRVLNCGLLGVRHVLQKSLRLLPMHILFSLMSSGFQIGNILVSLLFLDNYLNKLSIAWSNCAIIHGTICLLLFFGLFYQPDKSGSRRQIPLMPLLLLFLFSVFLRCWEFFRLFPEAWTTEPTTTMSIAPFIRFEWPLPDQRPPWMDEDLSVYDNFVHEATYDLLTHMRFSPFCIGVFLGELLHRQKNSAEHKISYFMWDTISFTLITFSVIVGTLLSRSSIDQRFLHALKVPTNSIIVSFFLWTCLHRKGGIGCTLSRILRSRILVKLAPLSYVVYLTHSPVSIAYVMGVFRPESTTPSFAEGAKVVTICLVICFFVGLVVHKLIEKPFQKLISLLLGWSHIERKGKKTHCSADV